jgi:FAD dependent oxidoreductase
MQLPLSCAISIPLIAHPARTSVLLYIPDCLSTALLFIDHTHLEQHRILARDLSLQRKRLGPVSSTPLSTFPFGKMLYSTPIMADRSSFGCFVAPSVLARGPARRRGVTHLASSAPRMSTGEPAPSAAQRPDVAVVGGGAAGLSAALAAALAGARVTVLSRAPDQAATRAAAGMLALNAEALAPGPMAELATESRNMYGDYVQMLKRVSGEDVGYVSRGDMLFPLLQGQVAPSGVAAVGRRLDGQALRLVEPCLSNNVQTAFQIPGDGQVDNRALFSALQKACSAPM